MAEDKKQEVDKLVRDLVFDGFATREFRRFDRRWRFKTLTINEHRAAVATSNSIAAGDAQLAMLKVGVLSAALVAVNGVELDADSAKRVVDVLVPQVVDELYSCYEILEYEQLTALKDTSKLTALVDSSFDRIKYKVMRSVGALPTEKRVREMSELQWMWYYLNIIEDKNEEEDTTMVRLDYLAMFMNPELLEQIRAQREHGKTGQRGPRETVKVNGNVETITTVRDTKVNEDFDAMLAAAIGDEQFTELPDEKVKGNVYESKEDFINRALGAVEFVETTNKSVLEERQALADVPDDEDVIEVDE